MEETRPRCREGRAEADRRPAFDRVAKRSLPSETAKRDREGGKTVPEYGGKANARRVADGIAMTTRPKRESPREAEEARETAATRCARATPDSGTASREPTPPSAAGAPAHAHPDS